MTDATEGYSGKEQVIDQIPKRIKSLQFGLLSPPDIVAQSVVPVADRNLYDISDRPGGGRSITKHGPLDQRLGTSSKTGICGTCGQGLKECNGHFGHVKLALPCFHYGYLKRTIEALNCVCKDCSRVLLPDKEKRNYLKTLRRPGLDGLRKDVIIKRISGECRKVKVCPHCSALNGPVRKVPGHPIKMFHNKYAAYYNSNARSKTKPADMESFESTFTEAKKFIPEVERHMRRAADDLTPLRVLNILKKVPNADIELLGMDPNNRGRPEYMLWTHVPAPPIAIRPSVAQESASTEDDITNKLGDIVQINSLMTAAIQAGQPLHKVMDMWEFLQVQIAMYIDGALPGLGKDSNYGKAMRGFCQRLKGKQGRFRGNLSGKRVDFSGRTVISPDPNLAIDEVAVPSRVAVNMTYPERVTKHNFEKLKACIRRGDRVHPGANYIVKGRDRRRIVLRMVAMKGDLNKVAEQLEIGDTVERHLEDGDIVLFNRQPSLHKLSILSHRAKIRPWRTFRLNECVCNPYNADFDGDEMNLHVPQTEEARTEATELMGVKHNLATPKNGTPIIAAIQDFITGAYLISQKDRFFSRRQFTQVVGFMYNNLQVKDPYTGKEYPIEIPPPAIWKPQRLWTGKQIWNILMKPHSQYPVNVNLEAKLKQYAPPERKGDIPDMVDSDSYLVIRNSEVMCGAFDKATVGDGKKDSVFYVILRDFGSDYAAAAMTRLAKLSARWLGEQGFSIGISDVYPSEKLNKRKQMLVDAAYAQCDEIIDKYRKGKLERSAGCNEEETMEILLSGILSKVRQQCGDACFAELSKFNAPLTMAKCGSKGSNINVSQMVAAVGQQIIGGKRVLEGFQDRTLPHFPKASKDPLAKGFVADSFFSGLTPTEFIFHAMSGREGLVDTAVKTAETGYMSRRLMKSLEDLSAQYDLTVRNSSSGVVQMKFGDDGLDPVDMEGNAKPVNFDRTWMHAITSTWDNSECGLSAGEIETYVQEVLDRERAKLDRFTDDGKPLPYEIDEHGLNADQLEYNRQFLDHVAEHILQQLSKIKKAHARWTDCASVFKLTQSALDRFLQLCLRKFEKSKVEAGHAVGAVGAQSIGEPGTQMTLKTFHFAGVAGMSITQGVPRIKEIINASKTISTPVITCTLDSKYEEMAARFAKALIEKTYLGDIVDYIEDVWHSYGCYLQMRVNWQQVESLGLRINMWQITEAIERTKGYRAMGVSAHASGAQHIRVKINVPDNKPSSRRALPGKLKNVDSDHSEVLFVQLHELKRKLAQVVISGYPDAQRAIIKKDDKKDKEGKEPISVLVEGYGFKACMTTEGVNGYHTTSNNIMECRDVLGIEAARKTIINEISSVMGGMDIDPRHMQLLADVMTYKGEILGITRFGLAKMRDSVLQLASFEKTPDHLFEAAAKMKKDDIEGVSECIIMGQSMSVGTGAMKVVRPLNLSGIENNVDLYDFKDATKGVVTSRKERLKQRRSGFGMSMVNGHAMEVSAAA
ncbi:DNA-directed RNA polymerase III subunit RPC1 [Lecanosticta acicola]|uniref:DNA-directed RNA polymerase subunit n=1 Tax=Lecanosticta acicola TaxID=111012 RepID=A0AAI8W0F5_9PEZI|nr:DNA-directed RNA polymerase III subunit RPC1 [Lecanosticta acicola]